MPPTDAGRRTRVDIACCNTYIASYSWDLVTWHEGEAIQCAYVCCHIQ